MAPRQSKPSAEDLARRHVHQLLAEEEESLALFVQARYRLIDASAASVTILPPHEFEAFWLRIKHFTEAAEAYAGSIRTSGHGLIAAACRGQLRRA